MSAIEDDAMHENHHAKPRGIVLPTFLFHSSVVANLHPASRSCVIHARLEWPCPQQPIPVFELPISASFLPFPQAYRLVEAQAMQC